MIGSTEKQLTDRMAKMEKQVNTKIDTTLTKMNESDILVRDQLTQSADA